MILAVIPARGGSKRIPRKNIRTFCGRPMLEWSIDAARESRCFDRIVVSTDDDEIAAIALRAGAEVPFRRPTDLSDDHATTIPVIAHTITTLGTPPNAPVCCIYPTAPFLDPLDLATGLARLGDAELDYVFSATDYGFPIQRALSIDAAGRVRMLQPEYIGTRSQDLETAYHDAGQFYWGRAGAWVAGRPIFGPASSIVALPRHRVQDIDTPEDWTRAELMFQAYMQARNHA